MKSSRRSLMSRPAISVIFSSYNGTARLPRTLASLVAQDFPADHWELIAVDNNSTDDTAAMLDGYRGLLPITILREPRPGKSVALNTALEHACGDLLVFTDDDVRAELDWLSQLWRCAEQNPEHGVFGGRIVPEWERAPRTGSFVDWIPMGSTFAIIDETRSGPCEPTRIWGPNTAIRRVELGDIRYREDIGPSPAQLFAMGEDQDIVMRLAAQGATCFRCAEAVIHHYIPASSVSETWVQQRAERLGFGVPALFPADIPPGPRLAGVPLRIWAVSIYWHARSALLRLLPVPRLRFWAVWQTRYLRGYRAGIRRYASLVGGA